MIWFVAAIAADWDTVVWGVFFELVGLVLVVLLLLVPELLLEVLLLPPPDVVDGCVALPPLLLLLLPSPVSVLLPPLFALLPAPVLPVSVSPAPWLDGIMDGSGVLLLLLLSSPLSLLRSILPLSDVVGGGGGGGGVMLLSWLLLPGAVGRVGVVVLPSVLLSTLLALPLVMSSLDFELVVLPALLLLSPTATVGVDASGVDLSSDLCLFFVMLVSSEAAASGGGHFPFTGIEPSGHGRESGGVTVLLLSELLPLCLLPPALVSDVAGGNGRRVSLASSVLRLSLVEGVVGLLFSGSSWGIVEGKGHFPFTGIEPSGHGRGRESRLLPTLPLLLTAWLLEGIDVDASGADLSSDLLFFAAKTLWDTSDVKAMVVTEKTRIKMVSIVIVW
jgi:hypothetical protein